MNWQQLTQEEQLENIISESASQPVLIFKHSTICPISSMAKSRLERNWSKTNNQVKPFYFDLIANRPLSAKIAQVFAVKHESPQVLLIKEGVCTYHASHSAIDAGAIANQLA